MRVALLSSGLVPLPPVRGGAVEEYVFQLTRHLRKLNVEAVAIDYTFNDSNVGLHDIDGSLILRIKVPRIVRAPKGKILQELVFGLKVCEILSEFDVVHANTAWASFAVALEHGGRGLVYTCHNPLWPEEKVHVSEHVVRLVEGYTMRRGRAVVALNKTMMKAIVSKARVDPQRIFIVPNGVDTGFFKPSIPADDIVKKYGLEGKRIVLFVGRVTYRKGVHLLLKAFRELITRYRDLKLVIVGPLADHFGEAEPSHYARMLMEYAEKNMPRDSYVFTGPVDRDALRKLYSTAYVCVLPSYAEAFPMVLIEALTSGCPVIGSNAGGIGDIIEEGVSGFIFKKGDYMDLKEKLEILLNNETLRKTMSINCREITERKYSWYAIATKLKEVYKIL
ncbi:MAG: hypothetical protein DRO12_06565 [Thermoprotei archaeon]|nr:MAG: hypothetical protein DRO12_06565 [Thermoprotei archaeon]